MNNYRVIAHIECKTCVVVVCDFYIFICSPSKGKTCERFGLVVNKMLRKIIKIMYFCSCDFCTKYQADF